MQIIEKTLLIIGIPLAGIFICYFIVVMDARDKTPSIVNNALHSDRMQLELDDLTDKQREALLKIQDPNFYHHKGYDFETPGTGLTTLSQGLVKMYYFENFKAGLPKIQQTLIARYAFDPLTPKDTTLKLFINEVYLGGYNGTSIHGLENGAEFYFNKPFKDLNWEEYLSLIAMIRAPATFNYNQQKEANLLRVARIKNYLSGEYIPEDNSDWLYDRERLSN